MRKLVGIIDLSAGNVHAIENIFKKLDVESKSLREVQDAEECSHIVLPGVGAFDDFMQRLQSSGFDRFIRQHAESRQKAIIGVCVGMKVLADKSDEGVLGGLGVIPGEIRSFSTDLVVPHMGWNSIKAKKSDGLLNEIEFEQGFYVLHSFYFKCGNMENSYASSHYGSEFDCIVQKGRTYGVQFHPEKSHSNGLKLFRNFLSV